MMKKTIDLLLVNAAQVVTCAGPTGPKRGLAMQDVGLIEAGAVAVDQGTITAVGPTAELQAAYEAAQVLDVDGRAVCPGLVDCHTHTVYGGDRVHEFELRLQGATYMEIMAAGGGIVSTMQQTRAAPAAALARAARRRLDQMLALGSTTVEIKTGYGLDPAAELKMLQVIEGLAQDHPCTLVPTFLGAHTLPPEFKEDGDGYVQQVMAEMLPQVAGWYRQSAFAAAEVPLFIDVFCEDHAFDVAQSRRILQAGQAAGLPAKIHVDQFNALGGLEMALSLGAVSADHLDVTGQDGFRLLAESDTISVLLPAVSFHLGLPYAPGRGLIDAGAAVALATDLNPGSAPCLSLPFVMAAACRYQNLSPAEALNAVTLNAAHALGLGRRLGSIEPGKMADLLVLEEADYRHLAYFLGGNPVAQVIKGGRLVR